MPGPGSGLSGQLMAGAEGTYGTAATLDHSYEINTEGLELKPKRVTSSGLRAGARHARSARRVTTTRDAGGPINLDVLDRGGMGLIFKQMIGSSAVPVQQGATPAWLQTHTPGDLAGKSLTIQKGVPQTDGTVRPFTFEGCKISEWELSCADGDLLKLALTVIAEDCQNTTALGTFASSSAANPLHFSQGALLLGGQPLAAVRGFNVKGSIPLADDRYHYGSAVKAEPIENGIRATTGGLVIEFKDKATVYDAFAADTGLAFQATFTGAQISGAFFYKLDITLPVIFFEGETPKLDGPGIVMLNTPFTAYDDGANPVITLAYTSTDSTL